MPTLGPFVNARARLVALVVSIVVVGGAAPAHADAVSVKDPRNDTFFHAGLGPNHGAATGRNVRRGPDATGLRVDHGERYVSVKVSFAELIFGETEMVLHFTDAYRSPKYWMRVSSSTTFPVVTMFDAQNGGVRVCGFDSVASGPRHKVLVSSKRGKNGYLRVRIPRYCLGHPDKVAVRASTSLRVVGGQYIDAIGSSSSSGWRWSKNSQR